MFFEMIVIWKTERCKVLAGNKVSLSLLTKEIEVFIHFYRCCNIPFIINITAKTNLFPSLPIRAVRFHNLVRKHRVLKTKFTLNTTKKTTTKRHPQRRHPQKTHEK